MDRLRKNWKKILVISIAVTGLMTLLVLEVFSRGAATIFNQAMLEQDMLKGNITAEKIVAHINGHVSFTNLEWYDPDGRLLLKVPEGSFHVRLWDVIIGHLKSTTIQELTLKNAAISVHLADDMTVDFIRQSPDMKQVKKEDDDWQTKVSLVGKSEEERKRIGEFRRRKQAEKMATKWRNFDRAGKKIRMELLFENCRVEVFFKDRHYLLSNVNLKADINTDKKMSLEMSTGRFGGTMIGDGVRLQGTVAFDGEQIPVGDLRLRFADVNPSSLGLGINIQDKMTMDSHLQGPLNELTGDGNILMHDLHIPGLHFQNLLGKLHYDGATLQFSEVEADVYGGHLQAEGVYDLDTRYYSIQGHGSNLQADKALPGGHLHCPVNLDINLYSKGTGRETTTEGSFSSGEGRYKLLPFKKISGRFYQGYRDLQFYDVQIEFAGFTVQTDGLRLQDKKLTMQPLKFQDIDGRALGTYERPDN